MSTKIQTRGELVAKVARLRSQKEQLEETLEEIGKLVAEALGEEVEETDFDIEDDGEEED